MDESKKSADVGSAVSGNTNVVVMNIREDLVNTAVKFLRNPKVQQTPLSQRREFLTKKGLNDAEINEALSRVDSNPISIVEEANGVVRLNHNAVPTGYHRSPVWRDYATALMFVTGTSYFLYKFVRGYVLPTWFNVPDPERERIRRLDENINDVQNGLKFLVDSVQQTLGVVQQQQETLNRLVNQLVEKDNRTTAQDCAIEGLKNEIAIIKSLLLSRDPLPVLNSTAPRLPAWQLESIARQPVLVNGDHGNSFQKKEFPSGLDNDEEDAASTGGMTKERFHSATGSEADEKTTPV